MPSDLETVRRALIDEAASALSLGGVDAPRREAMRIWSDLSSEGEATFQSAIRRRSAGEPLAHVTGRAGFRHLELASDRRALIPRPETEGLVELLLGVSKTGSVADVGTGSGCIALSLAQEGAYSRVVGTDISTGALALAGVNRDRCASRVSLVRGDLCGPLRTETFDALVSNPPYLTSQEYATLDASVRDWEPRQALVGGTDGLETIARLLDEGRDVVRAGGWLALEVDCSRAAECAGLAGALGWTDVAVHTDLFGRERYLLARRSHTQ